VRRAGELSRTLAPWLVAAFVLWATLARQADIPKLQTMWAEDGAVFAHCAYFDPQPLSCLLQPYAGYFHTVPRIGALIATIPAPGSLAIGLGVIAALVAAYVAFAVARCVIARSGSVLAGIFAAGSLALVFQAGREVGGNLANLHWILLAGGIVILVTGWLGRRLDTVDLSVLVAAGLSSAFAPILFVLALVLVAVQRPRQWLPLIVVTVCSVVQVLTSILTPRPNPPAEPIGIDGYLRAYFTDVIGRGPFGGLRLPPDWLVTAGFVVVLVVLIAIWVRQRGQTTDEATEASARPLPVIAAMLALAVIGVVVFVVSTYLNHVANPRYAYLPTVLTTAALILGAALLPLSLRSPRPAPLALGRFVLPAVCVVLAIGYARSFVVDARASNGPDFVAGYQGAQATCRAPAVDRAAVRIAPYPATDDWFVEIPCSRVR
jgi:hypothetical protein